MSHVYELVLMKELKALQKAVFLFVFLLPQPSFQSTAVQQCERFRSLWEPILSVLNQNPIGSIELADHLCEDLRRTNQNELNRIGEKLIEKKWSDRVLENQFFHAEVERLNQMQIDTLSRSTSDNIKQVDYRSTANQIIAEIEQNEAVSKKTVYQYDQGDQIGFCFGRALLVHYFLLAAGVPQKDIFKIFALGDLFVQKQIWHFHVAVLVRDGNADYLVVDPLFLQALQYQEWLNVIRSYDIKHPQSRIRFYVTDPRKFVPSAEQYSVELLMQPELIQFFTLAGEFIASESFRPQKLYRLP